MLDQGPVGWFGCQATNFFFDIPHFQRKKTQTLLRYLTECISLNILGLSTHRSQKLAIREHKTWNMRSNVAKWPNFFKTKPKITLLQQTQSLLPGNGLNGGEAHTVIEFHSLSHFIQFKCHASQALTICTKCYTCLASHGHCSKVLVSAHAK